MLSWLLILQRSFSTGYILRSYIESVIMAFLLGALDAQDQFEIRCHFDTDFAQQVKDAKEEESFRF